MKCEAKVMGWEQFEDGDIDPCDEEGTVAVIGFMLCAGCKDALHRFVEISNIVVKKRNEEN